MKTSAAVPHWRPAIFPAALAAVNLYFSKELLTLEYSQFMGSIEAAFISISRYMIDNWRDLSWFPLWYTGIPFQNSYPPLLHAAVAVVAAVLRISPALAYHVVTALFYCLGPIALYFMALRLTGSRVCSFYVGLIYSTISPSFLLMRSVRQGMGGDFSLRRFHALVAYGEGPHIATLALLPFAIMSLDAALTRRGASRAILTAFVFAAIALTNWVGSVALAIATFSYLLVRSEGRRSVRMWVRAFAIAALAYAFACPWLPPSTIRAIARNARHVQGDFSASYRILPLYCVTAVGAALALKWALHRLKVPWPMQFAVLFAVLIGAIPLVWEWFGIAVVPQADRYHLEMDLAICFWIVYALYQMALRARPRSRKIMAITLLAFCVWPARLDRRHARRMIQPIAIRQTSEYQVAQWFGSHTSGGRVFAPGTTSYWMNAFVDTPQFNGGFDPGLIIPPYFEAQYQLTSGENAGEQGSEIAQLWLKAYGVEAAAIDRRLFGRTDRLRDWPEAVSFGETSVYLVGERSPSLAHVMPRANLVRTIPLNGLDVSQLSNYVGALDDPALPHSDFRWTSRHSAEIRATLAQDQVVSTQIAYHPGWNAIANGRPCRLHADGLGLMVVETNCLGLCNIRLDFDGGTEMKLARVVSWSSIAASLLALAISISCFTRRELPASVRHWIESKG